MTAIYRWLWYLVPANPIMLRVIKGGSRRMQHMWARTAYLGGLILLLLIALFSSSGVAGQVSLTELAKSGAWVFLVVAYGQIILISLLAPLFMAGAINQEQSGETMDILLTTPLSNLQIVLGSLFGRLFFVLGLLASGLPLFAVLLIFGGVPIASVFVAFAVAAASAFFVGAVAIMLGVLRLGGRKSVFVFIIVIAGYLIVTWSADQVLRLVQQSFGIGVQNVVEVTRDEQATFEGPLFDAWGDPVPKEDWQYSTQLFDANGNMIPMDEMGNPILPSQAATVTANNQSGGTTTLLTPLHPLLVLEAYTNNEDYQITPEEELVGVPQPIRFYIANPLGTFAIITVGGSLVMLVFCSTQLRAVGQGEGWLHTVGSFFNFFKMVGVSRTARTVWHNPIAWREANARGNRFISGIARWGFLVVGVGAGFVLLLMYHAGALGNFQTAQGTLDDHDALHRALGGLLTLELAIIVLAAIYVSAGSVSKEREDGTLDLLLATPITPKQYIWGKLRGLVSYLGLMLLVPILTVGLYAGYTLIWGLAGSSKATVRYVAAGTSSSYSVMSFDGPLVPPEALVTVPLLLVPFVALCVAVGMTWSIRAKGVFSAVVPSVLLIGVVMLMAGMCGFELVGVIPVLGAFFNGLSPATGLWMLVSPFQKVVNLGGANAAMSIRVVVFISACIAAAVYSGIVWASVHSMVGKFDKTVRKLSGTG